MILLHLTKMMEKTSMVSDAIVAVHQCHESKYVIEAKLEVINLIRFFFFSVITRDIEGDGNRLF